jgi:hypothetical protein
VLNILHEIERLRVHGAAVISVADIGTGLYKHDAIEITAERLMVEHTPGTAQPLREFLSNRFLDATPRMFEQKLHICPHRRSFSDVENEIGLRRYLLTLISIIG